MCECISSKIEKIAANYKLSPNAFKWVSSTSNTTLASNLSTFRHVFSTDARYAPNFCHHSSLSVARHTFSTDANYAPNAFR